MASSGLEQRSTREVLEDHLGLAQEWGMSDGVEAGLEADLQRNVAEDVVVLINRGVFHGFAGVRVLADLLAEELPDHAAFVYTCVLTEGRMGFLEWTYEDAHVRVRDGADSYLIERGKIVAQTIHYTVEQK